LTAIGSARFAEIGRGSRLLQSVSRDGVFSEHAHWLASCVTPLRQLDHVPVERLIGLGKLFVRTAVSCGAEWNLVTS
jgi:hypothetical protein